MATEATRLRPAGMASAHGEIAHAELIFVVPAYDEEANLPRLLGDLERRVELFAGGGRLLIVDDGSTDGTADVVKSYDGPLPVELIGLGQNQGPGAAFRAGFETALARCGDDALVVTLEADTTSDLGALPEMVARAQAGADLVLADWLMENVSLRRRILSALAGVVVRRLLGLHATTVSSFFRVYRVSILRAGFAHYGENLMRERGFACKAELLAKLTAIGGKVEEVPVDLDWGRREGKSKMPVVRTMLAYWRMIARVRGERGVTAA